LRISLGCAAEAHVASAFLDEAFRDGFASAAGQEEACLSFEDHRLAAFEVDLGKSRGGFRASEVIEGEFVVAQRLHRLALGFVFGWRHEERSGFVEQASVPLGLVLTP
jgi:hypothetical protein